MDYVFSYVEKNGIETWNDYPYTGKDGKCKFDKSKVVFKNSGYKDVAANNNK